MRHRITVAFILIVGTGLITLSGCTSDDGSRPGAAWESDHGAKDASRENSTSSQEQNCDNLPPSQGLSEPCCQDRGVDACGANLFCAAFDGRTVPTCYADRSRQDGESCASDKNCLSSECHGTEDRCKATPGSSCTAELGCAKSPTADKMVCAGLLESEPRCIPTTGVIGQPCEQHTDCESERCQDQVCECAPDCGDRECGPDGCGNSCGSCRGGWVCSTQGQCGCPWGKHSCGGACVDFSVDNQNCGGCGKTCSGGTTCTYSEYSGQKVCKSEVYYTPCCDDCSQVCQDNNYARCWTSPRGGCWTYQTFGCLCERDPE
jgi:hypothetical protein